MNVIKTLTAIFCMALAASPVRAAEPVKIAFVDTGNTGRSVTAEALAQAEIDKDHLFVAVISRALDPDPYAIKPEANARTLLGARGIDVAAHRSAQLTENDVRHSDLILTMTAAHKEKLVALFPDAKPKTFTLAEYATGKPADVEDAFGKDMAFYRAMTAQVLSYIGPALAKAAGLRKRD